MRDFRTAAYARLGELGTRDSLAAVLRLEAAAKKVKPVPPATLPLDRWINPNWHFADFEPHPAAEVQAEDGTTYSIVPGYLMGTLDAFLVSSRTPENVRSWSRPLLLDISLSPELERDSASLVMKDAHTLVFHYTLRSLPPSSRPRQPEPPPSPTTPQERTFNLDDIRKDTDGDGWTDIEERRLGLGPAKADTDGDGLRDSEDCCPDFAPPAEATHDEKTQIVQRALYAALGISGSHDLLLANSKSPVQLWGFAGPVLYKQDREQWIKEHGYGGIFIGWAVKIDGDTAKVDISDWEGSLAAGSQTVTLRKIEGEWYVVGRRTGRVS